MWRQFGALQGSPTVTVRPDAGARKLAQDKQGDLRSALALGAMATTASGLEAWGRYWYLESISIALSSLRRFDPILCAATPCYCTTWYGCYGQLACNVGGVVIKHASTHLSTFSWSRGGQRDLAHHACLVAPPLPTKKKPWWLGGWVWWQPGWWS